jgi:membrane protease YdiL (CAAX protease family)
MAKAITADTAATTRRWTRWSGLAAIFCFLLSLFSDFSPTRQAVALLVSDLIWRRILSDVLNTAVFLALVPVAARLATGTSSTAISFRLGPLSRGLAFGAIACSAGYVALIVVIGHPVPDIAMTTSETLAGLLGAASLALVTGTVEEVSLRGGLQYLLMKALRGAPLVILAQGCVFVVLHLSNIAGWQGVAYYACFGGLMSLWSVQFRSVWPAVGGHFAINFVSGMLLGDAARAVPQRFSVDIVSLQALTACYFLACGLLTTLHRGRSHANASRPH